MPRQTASGYRHLASLLIFSLLFLGAGFLASRASAQTLVVPKFRARGKGSSKLARSAWKLVAQELKKKGFKLVSSKSYYRKARRMRFRRSRALSTKAIKRVSDKLGLDGVLIGSIRRKGRRYRMDLSLRGKDGSKVWSKAYRLHKRRFPRSKAKEVAEGISEKLAPAVAAAEPQPEPDSAAKPDKDPPPAAAPGGADSASDTKTDDSFLPAWARKKDKPAPAPAPKAQPKEKKSDDWAAENHEEAPAKRGPSKAGSVNDALLAVGASFHHRAGLNPRHEASLFPGLRVDGRMFLGTFLDMPIVKDIGVGGFFDMGLGLKYGYQGADEDWGASQMQWRGELLYRLAFDVTTKPALLIRVGYGSTSCSIDSDAIDVLDASYMAPYAGLDIYLTLWDPMLRVFASGSFLFLVSPGGDLNGSGMGFSVMAGIDADIIDLVHVGLGYDLTQYMMEADGGAEYSDTYQGFFVRAGVNFN